MAANASPARPAVHGHPSGRRGFVPDLRCRGCRGAGHLHHGLRPLCPRRVPGGQHRLPAQADQCRRRGAGAGQVPAAHGAGATRLRHARATGRRVAARRSLSGARARSDHPAQARTDRLLLYVRREGHGLRVRRCGLPARPDAGGAAGATLRGRFLPGQPAVHRGPQGRARHRRVVRGRLSLSLTVATPERIVVSKARVPVFKAWLTAVHPAE